jgi:hypothetical protein
MVGDEKDRTRRAAALKASQTKGAVARQDAALKAAETKGPDERRREALMAAWTRKHGKNDKANPYSKENYRGG